MTPELHRQFENSSPYDMIKELKSMFEKQARVERFDLIQTFHACKQEEGKPVGPYVLKMKGYVDQLERLGYVLPQDISVDLILYGLTSDFAGFVKNYNMHNMGKTVGELHALLIEYEKGLPKKAATSQVMAIQGGRIQKPIKNRKLLKARGLLGARKLKQGALYMYVGNSFRAQVEAIESYDLVLPNGLVICLDNCYYAPTITRGVSVSHLVDNGFTQCFTYYEISVSKNDVLYFNAISSNGIYENDMINRVLNVNSIYTVSNKRAKNNLDSTYLWHHRLAHISKKRIEKLQHDGLLKSTDEESFDKCVSCLSGKMTRKPFLHHTERATDLLGIILTDVCGPLRHVLRQACGSDQQLTPPYTSQHNWVSERRDHTLLDMVRSMMNLTTLPLSFWDYALETATGNLNMVQTKKVDKTPYELWYAEFLEKNLLSQEIRGWAEELEEIQDEDTPPSENTSKIPMEVEGFELPQEEVVPIRRSARTHRAPGRLYLNVEVEEHNNQVWRLVDLPPNCKTVGSKWFFKKKTDMASNVHTYKALLEAKARVAFYDYEIWKMDVKTAFLNGYLDEDIYMMQPEGFIDPKQPRKVCKLQRSIYGLKQASRSWNKRFDEEIRKFGFNQDLDEPCMYQKASGSNVTFLILYVDDIIIMGNHILSLQSVKSYLGKCFAMNDLGKATFILGIKIYQDRSKQLIRLSQSAYMDKILKRYRMDNSKRGNIPMQEKLDLNKTQGASTPEEVKRMQNVPYASAVGSIMYATVVKTILKHLRNSKDMFLVYDGNSEAELIVDCYCDVGFETDRDDTES
ncbi:retrotransposon protein, putative, ty1-copia subclass [Tanacetum coccineum]